MGPNEGQGVESFLYELSKKDRQGLQHRYQGLGLHLGTQSEHAACVCVQ